MTTTMANAEANLLADEWHHCSLKCTHKAQSSPP
eukprot:CAMPEP_0170167314 /NCGR_PEP_ID=MMETSP0040_2-20121228/758_1 /TAXON_ID=641309 /ORGANISM="Lotharella oceanica, Strain CCMP622" /LENGTH=33 /DNA_ID= /DNA_START= /DNA_END= /DNA_ORIENTATION=